MDNNFEKFLLEHINTEIKLNPKKQSNIILRTKVEFLKEQIFC
jgi:hypothetical protein